MASTFFGLTIAYTGLQAAQTSINVTSHNLANINNQAYRRQLLLRLVRHCVHMLNMEHLVQELSLMQLIR